MSDLRVALQSMEDAMRGLGIHKGLDYTSFGGIVARYGVLCRPRLLPHETPRGTPGDCFQNAWALVDEDRSLIYCEGFSWTNTRFPIHHAWAVDASGNVLDNTWPSPGIEYLGIPVDFPWFRELISMTGFWGLLNDFTAPDFMRAGLPPEAISEVAFTVAA